MTVDEAKRVLNAAGYVCVHWVPGSSWAVGYSDEIGANGLSIQLTPNECRAAAGQITAIWDTTPREQNIPSPTAG